MTDKTKKIFEEAGIQVEEEITTGFYKIKDPGVVNITKLSKCFLESTYYYREDHKELLNGYSNLFGIPFFILISDENMQFDYSKFDSFVSSYNLIGYTVKSKEGDNAIDTIYAKGENYA